MGDIFVQKEDNQFAIEVALYIQKETGISISATFNNTMIRPDQKNLELWIDNFRPLYQAGVKSCTLPHTHWLLTKQIKHNFPDLFVKNTILRAVKEPREVAQLAQAGFNYVNLDRVLMRDHDRLKEIKRAKDKYGIKLSLLANEGCMGGCPVMDEHFQFNNTRTTGPQYFTDPISRVSCPKWDNQDSAIQLKTGNFPPWREDWLEFLNLGIDVIKMHGRENSFRIEETMSVIKRFANKEEILFDNFNSYITDTNLIEKPINIWRQKIKTCKFNCWDCDYCDKVWRAKDNKNNKKVEKVTQLLVDTVNQPLSEKVEGLTSDKMRQLLNGLGKISTSYLEIGVLSGGTFCATIKDNNLKAYAVDNWKEDIKSADGKITIKASKERFIENVRKFKGNNIVKVFDCRYMHVDKNALDAIDLMLYDADHSEQANYQAVKYFADKFADEAVLIFDDANWAGVVDGAKRGISEAGLEIIYDKIFLNSQEDPEMWWNGFYIAIIKKK
jgi:predicted O-methyltransferase YrrM